MSELTPTYLQDRYPYASGAKTAGQATFVPGEPPGTRKKVIDAGTQDGLPRFWCVYLANPGPLVMEYEIAAGDATGGARGEVVTVPVFEGRQLTIPGAFLQVTARNVVPGNTTATASSAVVAMY